MRPRWEVFERDTACLSQRTTSGSKQKCQKVVMALAGNSDLNRKEKATLTSDGDG